MGAVDLESFVWASLGIEPPRPEDAIYRAGDQPIAGFDNFINWALTTDVAELNEWASNHVSEHEAGGSQELNLDGLLIGGAARLAADGDELRVEDPDGEPSIRVNTDADQVVQFPDFAVRTQHVEGANLGGNLFRNGEPIYDYGTDYFHRAEKAIVADWADNAGDSELHEGYTVQEILDMISGDIDGSFPATADNGTQQIANTHTFNFGQSIDVTTDGNTANMSVTSVPWADEAGDAHLHEGYTVQEIIDMIAGDIDDSFPATSDDGERLLDNTHEFDFGQSIDVEVTGSTAEMSVESVPHSEVSEYSYNSNRLNGYHSSDLIAMMGDGGRWSEIGTWEVRENNGFSWFYDLDDNGDVYDFYRLMLVHEFPHHNKRHRAINLQMNTDTRQRYNYRYSTYGPTNPRVTHHTSTGNRAFPLCVAPGTKRATAEYQIAAPRRIGSSGEVDSEDIYVGRVTNGVYPKTHPTFIHGALNSGAETCEQLHLYTGSDQVNLSIELWGRNIKR